MAPLSLVVLSVKMYLQRTLTYVPYGFYALPLRISKTISLTYECEHSSGSYTRDEPNMIVILSTQAASLRDPFKSGLDV